LEIIRERIKSRVLSRLDRGAVGEVESLLETYPDQNLPVYTTLGIKPIIKFINKEIDLPTLVNTWVTDETNYAKRQLTWFKNQPEIVWYDQ
jgi:tRNA dimethylallyltransferase